MASVLDCVDCLQAMNVLRFVAPTMMSLALAACATLGPADNPSHVALAATGVIADQYQVGGKEGSPGAYRPGMGGATGGLAAGLIMAARGTPEHTIYKVVVSDGSERVVRSKASLEIGTCVSVYTLPAQSADRIWELGEASLRKADTCKPTAAQAG